MLLLALVAAGLMYSRSLKLVEKLHGHRRLTATIVCVLPIVVVLVPLYPYLLPSNASSTTTTT